MEIRKSNTSEVNCVANTENIEGCTIRISDEGTVSTIAVPDNEEKSNNRVFDTGAIRDNSVGKGRLDLLPMDIIVEIGRKFNYPYGAIISMLKAYEYHKDVSLLYDILYNFINLAYNGNFSEAMLNLAKRYELGANHYGKDNWKKGLPNECLIDSGLRHLFKFTRGDNDEDHASAFLWNIITLVYNETK